MLDNICLNSEITLFAKHCSPIGSVSHSGVKDCQHKGSLGFLSNQQQLESDQCLGLRCI